MKRPTEPLFVSVGYIRRSALSPSRKKTEARRLEKWARYKAEAERERWLKTAERAGRYLAELSDPAPES